MTSEDLDLLTAACAPATFRRGNEDVYDESYCKAFKMGASDFAVQLDLAGSGLLGTIEDKLLHGGVEKMYIKPELYELNVYGDPRHYVFPVVPRLTLLCSSRQGFVPQVT